MISSFPWESETSPRRKRARRGPKSAMTKHVSLVGEEKHGESFGMLIEPRADEFLRKHVRSSDAFAISEVNDGILCDAYSAGTSRENLDVYEKESRAFQPFTKTPTRCPVLSRYVKGALKVSLGENLDVIRRWTCGIYQCENVSVRCSRKLRYHFLQNLDLRALPLFHSVIFPSYFIGRRNICGSKFIFVAIPKFGDEYSVMK